MQNVRSQTFKEMRAFVMPKDDASVEEDFFRSLGLKGEKKALIFEWFREFYSFEKRWPVTLALPFALCDINSSNIFPRYLSKLYTQSVARWLQEEVSRLDRGGRSGQAVARGISNYFANQSEESFPVLFQKPLVDAKKYVLSKWSDGAFDSVLSEVIKRPDCSFEDLVGGWVMFSGNGETPKDFLPGTWSLVRKVDNKKQIKAHALGRKNKGAQGRPVTTKIGEYVGRAPGSFPSAANDCKLR